MTGWIIFIVWMVLVTYIPGYLICRSIDKEQEGKDYER